MLTTIFRSLTVLLTVAFVLALPAQSFAEDGTPVSRAEAKALLDALDVQVQNQPYVQAKVLTDDFILSRREPLTHVEGTSSLDRAGKILKFEGSYNIEKFSIPLLDYEVPNKSRQYDADRKCWLITRSSEYRSTVNEFNHFFADDSNFGEIKSATKYSNSIVIHSVPDGKRTKQVAVIDFGDPLNPHPSIQLEARLYTNKSHKRLLDKTLTSATLSFDLLPIVSPPTTPHCPKSKKPSGDFGGTFSKAAPSSLLLK
jgi:hypothetical protein